MGLSPAAGSRSHDSVAVTNPYVFIVGCPRSGTTMLKRMIDAHPQIAITRETHWVTRYYKRRRGLTADARVTPAIVERWFEYHRFAHLGIKPARLARMAAKNDNLPYADFVSKLYDRYGLTCGKPIVGDKTPSYVRELPVLTELWPQTRIVHLIRDGRDVWLSMRQWRMAGRAAGQFPTWHDDPLVTTALWWKALVSLGRQDGRRLEPRRYREIQYESLVTNCERECQSLAEFLDVPYDPIMPRYYESHASDAAGDAADASVNRAWLPPTPGLRDWRTQMEASDVEAFEAAAGELLQQLGYELAHTHIGNAAHSRAERTKQAFTAAALEKRWRLPDEW